MMLEIDEKELALLADGLMSRITNAKVQLDTLAKPFPMLKGIELAMIEREKLLKKLEDRMASYVGTKS